MHLISAELKNFGQLRDLSVNFHRGLTGICGANASGKSTLMRAVHACLTNDFSRFAGIKTDNIFQFAGAKDKSYIRVTIEHQGQQAIVTRGMRPANRSLVVGGVTYTREDEVSERLAQWFNLPLKVVGDYLFVDQNQIASFLDETPTIRAKAIQRLFRLDRVETIWQALGERLTRLPEQEVADVAEWEAKRLRLNAEVLRLTEALAVLPDIDEDTTASLRKYLVSQSRLRQIDNELLNIAERHTQLTIALSELEEDLLSTYASLDNLKQLYPAEKIAEAQSDLRALRERAALEVRLQGVLNQLDLIQNEIPPLLPKEVPWTAADVQQWAQTAEKLAHVNSFLTTFDISTGVSACPTCGTATDQLADQYSAYKEQHATLLQRMAELQRRKLESWQEGEVAAVYIVWGADHQKRLAALQIQRDMLQESIGPQPAANAASLESFLIAARAAAEEMKKLEICSNGLEVQQRDLFITLGILKSQRGSLETEQTSLFSEMASVTCTEEEAQALMQASIGHKLRRDKLSIDLTLARRELSAVESTCLHLRELQKQAASRHEWRQSLEELRAIFHRDALPASEAQRSLELLEGSVNRNLEELGVNFRITVGEHLTFRAKFFDGREQPAERLSGGEKVVFALAWRLAVNAEFATDVGILCLDEPTAGLDDERLECLRRALGQIRSMTGSHGLQCVMITHERSFLPLFDHVIELSPPQ